MRNLIRTALLSAGLAAMGSAGAAEKPLHLYVEAEDCDSLLRYPYHNEETPGWYAREANCRGTGAPGHTYCAAIHESSAPDQRTMSRKLDRPLPPGTYRAFLRVPVQWVSDQDTVVRLGLGKATGEFRWRFADHYFGFLWLPGIDLTLAEATDTVTFTAAQFGGNSMGTIYEPVNRSIWIDTLYLTSDLTVKEPPPLDKERLARAGIAPDAWPARPPYLSDEQHKTPPPESKGVPDPILLASFDGRKNLWPNSSFELGMNDGWAGTQPWCVTDKDLDPDKPFHGSWSLRVPVPPDPKTWVPGPEPAVRLTPGIYPFSRPYYLSEAADLCLSVYVRGKAGVPITAHLKKIPGKETFVDVTPLIAGIKPAISAKGTLAESWTRIQASGKVDPGWYYLSFECADGFWMDAIQLEKGSAPTAYAPRAEIEGAIRTGQLANVIYDEQKKLPVWFHNSGAKKAEARLRYRIVDIRERVVAEGVTPPVSVAPGQTLRVEEAIAPPLHGLFSLTWALEGRPTPEGETVYMAIPAPAKEKTRHELGVNTTLHPVDLAIHSRMGIKWVLTCKTIEVGKVGRVHPSPNTWNWQDARVARPKDFGMQLHPGFWPDNGVPDFLSQPITRPQRPTKNQGTRKTMPKLDLWKEYVATVAEHYKKDVRDWNIDDEVEVHWDPAIYADLVNATLDSLRTRVPEVRAGTSCTPEYTEELLRYVDASKLGFFASSAFDFQYWQSRYTKRLKDQYGKEWISYGVGARAPAATMYHTVYTYQPIRWKAAWVARQMINMLLLQDLNVAGHYSGIWRNAGNHLPGDKPLVDYDGTPLPGGATFATMGRLLAEAEPLEDLPLGDTGRRVYVFQSGKQLGAVTWATCTRDYDHHWKTAERTLRGLALTCAKDSVAVRDMYWNPFPSAAWRDQLLTLDLDEEPTFIMNQSLSKEEFIQMLTKVTMPPPPVGISFTMETLADNKLALGVRVVNRSGKDLKGLSLDARYPPGKAPFSAAGEWIFMEPFKAIGDLPSGKEVSVSLPMLPEIQLPLEDAVVRTVLRSSDGGEWVVQDSLWLMPAPRAPKPPVMDGKLDEWEKRSAAWLFYDHGWNLLGRSTSQLDEGGEHFGFPPYTVDGRAAFWSSWDAENLYLALRMEDDQPIFDTGKGEKLRIVLRPKGKEAAEIEIHPAESGQGTATLKRQPSKNIKVVSTSTKAMIKVEISIPWKDLGASAKPGDPLDFDLFWTDVDRESGKLVSGTLRWAGASRNGGTLLLR